MLARLRPFLQIGFLLLSLLIGLEFHLYLMALAKPGANIPPHPAAVDAFLPISALMSLIHLLTTGQFNAVRPAGLVMFALTLILTIALRRGFCSWICPFGSASEWLHKLGRRLLGRNLIIPRPLDLLLQFIKYAILAFFLYAIIRMVGPALDFFIHGHYNRIADAKMYLLFAQISLTTAITFSLLGVLSMVFKNFWCRYLCPYGALLGLLSILSPFSIRRNNKTCLDCGRCTRACPNRIKVHRKTVVRSPECTACYSCVSACPSAGTLKFAATQRLVRRTIPMHIYGIVLLAAFIFTPQIAKALGRWHGDTPPTLYRHLLIHVTDVQHPRTTGFAPQEDHQHP